MARAVASLAAVSIPCAGKTDNDSIKESKVKMPTLELQLAKAQTALDLLNKEKWIILGGARIRADTLHGDRAEARGLTERVGYLQQKIAVRDERIERAELRAAAAALMRLRDLTPHAALPTHTSEPTVPA